MTDKTKYFYAFSTDERFALSFAGILYNYFGDIEKAWTADFEELINIDGITSKKAKEFVNFRNETDADKIFNEFLKSDIGFITTEDELFPKLLKEIHDAPLWLYFKGNAKLLENNRKLAVVGSRKSSITAKTVLDKIISEFENTNLCVVSGMAAGIDSAAHSSALKYNLPTIAVLGSGLKNIYPQKNKELFDNIISSGGLVISEYPPYSPPIKFHFPLRNRIVSGMCKGTLVAEAALKSGALITAKLCLEQNRELMCIPGAINNPGTEGIYKLLKEGAGIVTCGQDILNYLDWQIDKVNFADVNSFPDDLSEEERKIADILSRDALTIDEISYRTGFDIDSLMLILTNLELKDIITQLEGEKYSLL